MPHFTRDDFIPIAEEMAHALHMRHTTNVHMAFVFGPRHTLLASAINRAGSRSLGAGFSGYTIHAERAALKAVGDIRKLDGASLVVIRVGKKGEIMGSEPCSSCRRHLEKCMRDYGLKYVFYS